MQFPLRTVGCWILLAVFISGTGFSSAAASIRFAGVNLAGAEFGEGNLPGTFGVHYTYPNQNEVDYFQSKGMNVVRLPFRWERLQQSLNGSFNSAESNRLHAFVTQTTAKGVSVILDPHNYARYHGNVIGSAAVPNSAFADFWARLATLYRTNHRVIFGLMNEPNSMETEAWRDAANAAISAIRAAGATNLILVPGNAWTGAHSWLDNWYGTPNGTVMLTITDPANHFAFDVHQYLDSDSSGTSGTCVSANIGPERLAAFTAWCRTNGFRGFLGEFAGSTSSGCLLSISNMLAYLNANLDVWEGWTWWAAGPWWGEYMFTLEPTGAGAGRPQMDAIEPLIPIPAPVLQLIAGNQIRFAAQKGFLYQSEAAPGLQSTWTNHGAAITGSNHTATVLMAPGAERKFFRVRVSRSP